MLSAANIVSAIGVVLFVIGAGYWVWSGLNRNRIAMLRGRGPIHLLGTLTVIGMFVLVLGRILAKHG